MAKSKEQVEFEKWLEEGDPFGLNEEIKLIPFTCVSCGVEDDVPDFVVEDFALDLTKGEVVKVQCPSCGGTMHETRTRPK